MREFCLNASEFPGCCRIQVIFEFHTGQRGVVKDDEWFEALVNLSDGEGLITFAHSSRENTGTFTPKNLAAWLTKQEEEVVEITHRHITLYACALSKKFKKALDNYKKKKEAKESAEYHRGAVKY